MAGYKKAVIVVHRKENREDFQQIARRIRKLDPSIGVVMISELLTSKMVPPDFLNIPLLVIYLCNPPPTEFAVATKIAVKEMGKVDEYAHFKQHNLPCLPIEKFQWGMELDPAIYGDWVVLKPEHIQSTGKDVNMVPTKLIPTLKLSDFPENHLIRQDSYLVQKFVKTGEFPTHFRVLVFLGEVLYSKKFTSNLKYPEVKNSLSELLEITVASNNWEQKTTKLEISHEINEFALLVASKFKNNPMLGIDIIRDELTGKLYVLEANAGGNTWHFSSNFVRNLQYSANETKAMVLQYGAWDRAAEALVRKTHELAS